MVGFHIFANERESAAQIVEGDDTGTIESGGRLEASIMWKGGSASPGVTINNSGMIAAPQRGIDTLADFTAGSITLNNNLGATLTSPNDAFRIDTDIDPGGIIVVNNSGTIESTASGQAIDFNNLMSAAVHVTITNEATGVIQAANADAVRPGENATINNHGQIIARTPFDPNTDPPTKGDDAIDFQSDHAGGVVNNFADGSIIGTKHGIGGDLPINDSPPIEINNAGMISGQAGAGINLDIPEGLDLSQNTVTTTTIYNSGTIVGHAVEGLQSGDGVDVDGLVYLSNHGLIEALETRSDGTSEAVTVGGGNIYNYADGIIFSDQSAITVDGGDGRDALAATWIYNEGTIEAADHGAGAGEAIRIVGSFDDTIINHGFIHGSIHTDGGDDTVDSSGGSGNVVVLGGPGNDRLVGGNGDDELHGDNAFSGLPAGNDTLIGGRGNDFLDGDAGDDILSGGLGQDAFVYIPTAPDEGRDVIQDFTPGEDRIELRRGFDIDALNTVSDGVIDTNDGPVTAITNFVNGIEISGLLMDFGDGKTLSVFGATETGEPLLSLTSLSIESDVFFIA
jgi:hypothetical protein